MADDITEAPLQQIEVDHLRGTAHGHTSTMSQLCNGKVPRYLSSAITAVPALSEVTFHSSPEYRSSYIERELCGSSITPFDTFLAANDAFWSTCTSASIFTSDLRINNESPNGKLSSGSYVIGTSGCDTSLPSTQSSYKGNPSSLRMDYPKVSEQISWSQEPLPGVSDYPTTIDVSDQQNVTIVSQQIQDIITVDYNTHLAKRKEWFSSGSSGQFLENPGSAGSVLKVSDLAVFMAHDALIISGVLHLLSFLLVLCLQNNTMTSSSSLN